MKLYKVPKFSLIAIDNERFKFYRIDGAYSYCETMKGEVVHIHANTEVEVLGKFKIGG